uniref:Uncharacterized protein n=1 Tax=Helianthus annuus TaxID=4232 RepID=A0A251T8H0_HELAN
MLLYKPILTTPFIDFQNHRKFNHIFIFTGANEDNYDVFLSFNYMQSVGVKGFPILRSRICTWVWAH